MKADFGHIVLANSKKELFASLIKWITRSNWSHSLFTLPPVAGREMGMEAASNGVDAVPFDTGYRNNPGQGYRMYRVNLPKDIKEKAISRCLDELEGLYGYFDLPWFVWRALNRAIGRDIKGQNNWANQGKLCSILVTDYLTACGLGHLFADYGRNSICPQDLQEIMDAQTEHFELIEIKE